MTWGDPQNGGDSSRVKDQLKNVQKIQASGGAFAAILADGSVVTWGRAAQGFRCTTVPAGLRNVQHIQASRGGAFAAILGDGYVVTWSKMMAAVIPVRCRVRSRMCADPVYSPCFCCHSCRWFCRDLGSKGPWW